MIVIVASALDAGAARLAERWRDEGAAVLDCADLSRRGWFHRLGRREASSAVVAGQIVDVRSISAVLTRRPWIFPVELTGIHVDDREYVASEMNAFLLSWLSDLTCPVLNPPTATCLAGPGWPLPRWLAVARELGIETAQAADDAADQIEVTVVGDACFDTPDAATAAAAWRLAEAANVRLLTVRFTLRNDGRTALVGVSLWPDLDSPGRAESALEQLRTPSRSPGAAR